MIEVRVQHDPISLDEVVGMVANPEAGAIAIFLGTVRAESGGRRVVRLEYDAYPEMAEKEMRRIAGDTLRRGRGLRMAMVHRTGVLEIGETAVAVAVAAAHRAEAFECCRNAMEELKREVPIWKKEVYLDGEAWIE